MALRRKRTPSVPIVKSTALRERYQFRATSIFCWWWFVGCFVGCVLQAMRIGGHAVPEDSNQPSIANDQPELFKAALGEHNGPDRSGKKKNAGDLQVKGVASKQDHSQGFCTAHLRGRLSPHRLHAEVKLQGHDV